MAAEAYFRERYGDAVAVQWLAPACDVERARAFGAWTRGRILRVYSAIDRNGERRGSATVHSEDAAEIVVAVTCFVPLSPRRRVGGYKPQHHDMELARPSPTDARSNRGDRRAPARRDPVPMTHDRERTDCPLRNVVRPPVRD